jgi:hypothetical protein
MDKVLFTKENIDDLLFQLAKEFRRLNGRKTPAEIVIIGGAAIVTQYGFRASTTDIDAIIVASSVMKDAINIVGDRNGLPTGWINQEFKKTSSYSPKIREYSKHYKTFSNILEVRVLPSEYNVAMKLASLREYKYDMSDVVGIIHSEKLTRDTIDKAVDDLYGGYEKLSHHEDAMKLLDSIFDSGNLDELYDNIRSDEAGNHLILKQLDEKNPQMLKQDNIAGVLEAARKKLNNE